MYLTPSSAAYKKLCMQLTKVYVAEMCYVIAHKFAYMFLGIGNYNTTALPTHKATHQLAAAVAF